jgi:hypothetical protein
MSENKGWKNNAELEGIKNLRRKRLERNHKGNCF